jgi:solute carrier family 35 protein E1
MTATTTMESASPATANGGISKFPAFAPDSLSHYGSGDDGYTRRSTSSPERAPSLNLNLRQSLDNETRFQPPSHWQPRRNSRVQGSHSGFPRGRGHGRQRSLSEAIQVIRERQGSMSQNAQEIADALKAPVSPRLVVSTRHTHVEFTRQRERDADGKI